MKEMQFSTIVMMVMMCSALVLIMPERVKRDKVINRSRWLMVGALGLIGAQFLVQYITHLRDMGVTPAVLVNLVFFVPASGLMSLTVLNLQRNGRLSSFERWLWVGGTLLVMAVLTIAVWTDGRPVSQLSERVRWTEMVLGFAYAVMQLYYSTMQLRELERMQAAIENYYDSKHKELTAWVKASEQSSFTRWITTLRIEEAKRVLQEHRDWTNEAVADHCGFSRAYFQKIFKQATGVAPSDYLTTTD